jgi:hypothetical protein
MKEKQRILYILYFYRTDIFSKTENFKKKTKTKNQNIFYHSFYLIMLKKTLL